MESRRQAAAVIDVRVRDDHKIDSRRIKGQAVAVAFIAALLKSAVDEKPLSGCIHTVTAPCYFLIRSIKCQPHTKNLLLKW